MIMCAHCGKNPAPIHQFFGPLWCKPCNDAKEPMPEPYPEFIPEYIREGRHQHREALLQPYRDGEFSAEFKEAHPQQALGMLREGVITQHQYTNAKNVWMGDELR